MELSILLQTTLNEVADAVANSAAAALQTISDGVAAAGSAATTTIATTAATTTEAIDTATQAGGGSPTLLLVFLFGALAVSFLCSLLESTLLSTPLSYVTMREDEGYRPAKTFKKFKTDSSRPIAAILSLNTIANTLGAAGVGAQATLVFGSKWFGLISVMTTILILVFSEIIPKTIGTNYWKSLMGIVTPILKVLVTIMFPIVVVVEFLTRLITPKESDTSVSREEVSAMANVAEEGGDLEEDENTIIQNLINMDEVTAEDAMTPRVVCAIASENMSVKNFYKDKSFRHHSRIPVYADNDEYITGYILRVDALQLMAEDRYEVPLSTIRRDIASFQDTTPLDKIWDEMLGKDEQIAVVIDEYGSFQGILTLEDVIETLLGSEIVDEKDTVRDMQQLARDRWKKLQTRKGAAAPKASNPAPKASDSAAAADASNPELAAGQSTENK
jgi:CBS domain containing-hemolysin-like protein